MIEVDPATLKTLSAKTAAPSDAERKEAEARERERLESLAREEALRKVQEEAERAAQVRANLRRSERESVAPPIAGELHFAL